MTPLHRAVGLAVAGAWGAWCHSLRVEPYADETHYARTPDGWRIALSRYRRSPTRRHPVVLCPGLSANRVSFDLDPSRSLARFLAGQGFDVWTLELRGHGLSDRPSLFGERRFGWSFDDYLRRDLPAALAAVLAETGRDAVHWIGHSMGGLLLYAHLASSASPRIRSGIAVGSSLDYSGSPSDFHQVTGLRKVAQGLPAIPLGPFAFATAPLAGRIPNRLEEFNVWLPNIEPHLARRLNASAFHQVSTPVLQQLATAMEHGGLRSADGSIRYMDGLALSSTPVLALAGNRDRQCAPAAAKVTLDALGTEDTRFVQFGKEHGQREHYGHFDLLVGRNASTEVWPLINGWLAERD